MSERGSWKLVFKRERGDTNESCLAIACFEVVVVVVVVDTSLPLVVVWLLQDKVHMIFECPHTYTAVCSFVCFRHVSIFSPYQLMQSTNH